MHLVAIVQVGIGFLVSGSGYTLVSRNKKYVSLTGKYYTSDQSVTGSYETFEIVSKTIYSKGSNDLGEVKGTVSNKYPQNDKSGNYWYVYKGEY